MSASSTTKSSGSAILSGFAALAALSPLLIARLEMRLNVLDAKNAVPVGVVVALTLLLLSAANQTVMKDKMRRSDVGEQAASWFAVGLNNLAFGFLCYLIALKGPSAWAGVMGDYDVSPLVASAGSVLGLPEAKQLCHYASASLIPALLLLTGVTKGF